MSRQQLAEKERSEAARVLPPRVRLAYDRALGALHELEILEEQEGNRTARAWLPMSRRMLWATILARSEPPCGDCAEVRKFQAMAVLLAALEHLDSVRPHLEAGAAKWEEHTS